MLPEGFLLLLHEQIFGWKRFMLIVSSRVSGIYASSELFASFLESKLFLNENFGIITDTHIRRHFPSFHEVWLLLVGLGLLDSLLLCQCVRFSSKMLQTSRTNEGVDL